MRGSAAVGATLTVGGRLASALLGHAEELSNGSEEMMNVHDDYSSNHFYVGERERDALRRFLVIALLRKREESARVSNWLAEHGN